MSIQSQVREVQLVYKRRKKISPQASVRNSDDAIAFLRKIWPNDIDIRERSYLLLLNQAGDIIGYAEIGSGGLSSCIVDVRLIFSMALNALATAIIVAHNHPSGNRQASSADIELTKRIVEAGALLTIKVLDHIILTEDNYTSMCDAGYM